MSMLKEATAPHLPSTSAERSAGFISKGSRDPRSRSPARRVQRRVERAVEHRHDHEEGQHAGDLRGPRLRARQVALFDCIGSSNSADTPRHRQFSVARSRLKPPSNRWMRPLAPSACLLALSLTTSTTGGRHASTADSKSSG